MAQYRQSGGERFAFRSHDLRHGNGSSDQISSLPARMSHKQGRIRRSGRSDKNRKVSIGALLVIFVLVLLVTFFAFNYLSQDKEYQRFRGQDDDLNIEFDFLSNVSRTIPSKELKFGHGSAYGGDSRYWDRDDRRRDRGYNEDSLEVRNVDADGSTVHDHSLPLRRVGRQQVALKLKDARGRSEGKQEQNGRSVGLYNEAGRDELKYYEAEYEASLKNLAQENRERRGVSEGGDMGLRNDEADYEDDYDELIDSQDAHLEELNDAKDDNVDYLDIREGHEEKEGEDVDVGKSSNFIHGRVRGSGFLAESENSDESFTNALEKKSSLLSESVKMGSRHSSAAGDGSTKRLNSDKKTEPRRKGKRRKFSSSSCGMKFLNSTAQLVEPLETRKFSRFSLQYSEIESSPIGEQNWKPRFAGYQSLEEREESFYARDQRINCGFIKGPTGYPSTGFDLAEDDVRFMQSCHIAVSSCIFGNSDNLRRPTNKVVTRLSRKNVCFVMFMDENTLQTLLSEGQKTDPMGYVGLWKIVVIKNLPYDDMRRVGKIPKLLTHRLFPSARYSIWLDSKLRLQSDPLLILEYFLWRRGSEYAISNHYDRHCVWEEVMQNKKLNKYNHTVIDEQFAFYQADGLKRFNASDPYKLLPSYVPEGSFIVRAHTPMSNLFSCLWFNEVDRFTPRDQLSFAYTYLKLQRMNPGKTFHLHMFKDCERRSVAKLFRHRPEAKRHLPAQATE